MFTLESGRILQQVEYLELRSYFFSRKDGTEAGMTSLKAVLLSQKLRDMGPVHSY